eukprot:4151506-Pyramimonas_sp.AAC.2
MSATSRAGSSALSTSRRKWWCLGDWSRWRCRSRRGRGTCGARAGAASRSRGATGATRGPLSCPCRTPPHG